MWQRLHNNAQSAGALVYRRAEAGAARVSGDDVPMGGSEAGAGC